MSVAIRADRKGDHARIVPTGPFGLAHATTAARAVENAEALLAGCSSVDVDLAQLDRIDGAGAVLLARLLDRLDADGHHASVIEGPNGEAARLIARYWHGHCWSGNGCSSPYSKEESAKQTDSWLSGAPPNRIRTVFQKSAVDIHVP